MISRIACIFTLLMLTACATPLAQKLERIRPGMDKAEVLEAAGDPKRTFRTNSQDHWIYVFFRGNREMLRTVIFEGGKVLKILPATPKVDWDREIEGSKKGS